MTMIEKKRASVKAFPVGRGHHFEIPMNIEKDPVHGQRKFQ